MPLKRLAGHVRAAFELPRDLLLGRYPEFVTGGSLPRGHIPVFVFHTLEPASFSRKLQYLSDNGYRTVSATEYFHALMGATAPPDRAVLLTFDDGRGSVRSVGLPFMRRYGFKGTVFLVPGRIVSRGGPPPPTWDDVTAGRARPEAVLGRDQGAKAFLSWEEIAELSQSGLFDFQSHTLLHSRIHTGPQVAGFMTPTLGQGIGCLDVSLVRGPAGELLADGIPLGTPLFRSEPRTSESLRFFEDPRVREDCVGLVAREGNEGFFYRKGWERELRGLLSRRHVAGRFETAEERGAAILEELRESKRIIEEHTGREVLHICYPWHVSGPTSRRLAREVGYRAAFCGKVPGTPITLPGGNPHAVARIGEDYVELLPGRGRADLTGVLGQKWARRLKGAP